MAPREPSIISDRTWESHSAPGGGGGGGGGVGDITKKM